jgi:hypothetical protein
VIGPLHDREKLLILVEAGSNRIDVFPYRYIAK